MNRARHLGMALFALVLFTGCGGIGVAEDNAGEFETVDQTVELSLVRQQSLLSRKNRIESKLAIISQRRRMLAQQSEKLAARKMADLAGGSALEIGSSSPNGNTQHSLPSAKALPGASVQARTIAAEAPADGLTSAAGEAQIEGSVQGLARLPVSEPAAPRVGLATAVGEAQAAGSVQGLARLPANGQSRPVDGLASASTEVQPTLVQGLARLPGHREPTPVHGLARLPDDGQGDSVEGLASRPTNPQPVPLQGLTRLDPQYPPVETQAVPVPPPSSMPIATQPADPPVDVELAPINLVNLPIEQVVVLDKALALKQAGLEDQIREVQTELDTLQGDLRRLNEPSRNGQ